MTKLAYVDRPELSEVYADRFSYAIFDGRNVRFELVVSRPHIESVPQDAQVQPTEAVPVARFVLPLETVAALQNHLAIMLKALVSEGVLKDFGPTHATKQ